MGTGESIRIIKRVQKKLAQLEKDVNGAEYVAVIEGIRAAPFPDLRKACFAIVRRAGGEDETAGNRPALEKKYNALKEELEKWYSIATLGTRGSKIKEGEFEDSYQNVVKALADFLALAEKEAKAEGLEEVEV